MTIYITVGAGIFATNASVPDVTILIVLYELETVQVISYYTPPYLTKHVVGAAGKDNPEG